MQRELAVKYLRDTLNKHNLTDWHIRLTADLNRPFLGLCSYKDKCIILNAHHVDTHPDIDVEQTILHEVAHALTPGHSHDEVWREKAKELGCTGNALSSCSHLSYSPEIIDAIRSGADVKIDFETETHVITRPKYTVTRLQDKCETCGKVAEEVKTQIIEVPNPEKPDLKFITLKCGHVLIKHLPKGTPFQTLVSNWWRENECKHEWNLNRCAKCGEAKLFPFQVEGARFLESALASNHGGSVFDEMGLGKTIQALSYLKYHPEAFPVLFVVKSGIKYQWLKELLKWLGPAYIPQVIESSKDWIIPNMKCYVVSYDIFTFKTKTSKNGKVSTQGMSVDSFDFCKTVVLDECQQIKNPDASRTQNIRKVVKNKKVIGLSGTPWKNRASEFFTILNMLSPTKFPSYQGYLRRWVEHDEKGRPAGINRPEDFKKYISDVAIRREVFEVGVQMPDVNRTLQYSHLEKAEQKMYDEAESDFVKFYNDLVISGEDETNKHTLDILAEMSRMRHLTGLAKIPDTVEFAEEFAESTDRKLTVFVHHIDVGDILYEEFRKKFVPMGIEVYKLTGSQTGLERAEVANAFQDSKRAFLIASTLAAGEGINLQSCGDAILHERQWNPQNEDQAAPGRFRRIGAAHSVVNVTFMTAVGTIDEIIAGIVERKRNWFHAAMNKGEAITFNESDMAKEIADAIVKGHREKTKLQKAATPSFVKV